MASNDNVVIAGGGIGGLSAALALARKGFRVRVIEQAREIGGIGYGIQLGPNVFHALDRLGLSDAVRRASDSPEAAVWFDAYSGREVMRVEAGPGIVARFGYPYIIIHRGDLHVLLMDACRKVDAIAFTTGTPVAGYEEDGDGVAALTADGGRFAGAALIGADGLRSKVRAQMTGATEPRFIGWVAHRTTIPTAQVPEGVNRDIVGLWGGEGFHIVHYPLRHGTLFNIVTVFRSPTYLQKVDRETFRAELRQTYARAHPVMKKLIDLTDLDWRGAVADRDPIRHWCRGSVTLMGDAAHPTLQSLAQGACMAVEDAVCLADLMEASGGDYPAAFRRFEAARAVRAARVILESRFMWTAFHAEGAAREPVQRRFGAMSRDQVWDSLAWLYDGFGRPASRRG